MSDIRRRLSEVKTTRWIRFSIVAIVYILWTVWMNNYWLLLGLVLLADIYLTGYIPFTWWKKSSSPAVRSVMSWVDAIVYALILAYFVFAFIGQNYQIPSSSLEKTLLTGDYLFVNKTVYGPRVPMTPVHFPLVHNTFPIINTKSYLDSPSLPYHRLPGLRSVERGDIVVFNFPAGDTIMEFVQNPDYYTLCKIKGRDYLLRHPEEFGKRIYRPIDRRENYVKRCVGLPGDFLKIVDGVIYINGEPLDQPEMVQFNYLIQTDERYLTEEEWEQIGVAVDDRRILAVKPMEEPFFDYYGFSRNPETGAWNPIQRAPLSEDMLERLQQLPVVTKVMQDPAPVGEFLFPDQISAQWSRANYGGEQGIWIPRKGQTLKLTPQAWQIYGRAIKVYENNPTAELRDGQVYIDNNPVDYYTFKQNYYFMMGDNRDNSLDSRYWGFVPDDHIVGTPWRVLISFDKDKNLFNGGIRFNRILKDANPDKH